MLNTNVRWFVAVAAIAACAGGDEGGVHSSQPVRPTTSGDASPVLDARETATQFWVRLSQRDHAGAAALASYPFDLDAHAGCIESVEALDRALADDDLPPEAVLVVGRTLPIASDGSSLAPEWIERFGRYTAPDAQCMDSCGVEAGEYIYFFVEFTVNGEQVGAITRVRCRLGRCGVAGMDN
jgi:hypothetical protein